MKAGIIIAMELEPNFVEKRLGFDWARIRLQAAIFLGTAILAVSGGKVIAGGESGDVHTHKAVGNIPTEIDNEFKMASWNVQRRAEHLADEIDEIAENEDLDVFALQEVEPAGIEALEAELPDWNITVDPVRPKPEVLHENLSNALITKQEQRNIKTQDIEGTPIAKSAGGVAMAVVSNVPDLLRSYNDAASAIQENRSVVAATIKVRDGDNLRDIRPATTHISGNKIVHPQHLRELMEFADKELKDTASVICGDINTGMGEFNAEFSSAGFAVPLNESQPTSTSGRTIDHCAYFVGRTNKITSLGRIRVLSNYQTDHHPIVFSLNL